MEVFEMEPGQIQSDGYVENTIGADPVNPPTHEEHFGSPIFEPSPTSSSKKKNVKADIQVSQEMNTTPSVSNCYVFKSRLQEYAQKAGLTTPFYETNKEGPSHQPSFKSCVILDEVRYHSLPGFSNRKAAEQSAAEVALVELAKSTDMKFGISQPVHDTGLCKNLLQEYAQKMNYAIPLYECRREDNQGKMHMYSCVVEIGGIKYIGASASTKKEAEIKAARTALLAIQSSPSEDHIGNNSIYTVIPQKRNVPDIAITTQETKAALKPKKGRFKNKLRWKKRKALKSCTSSAQGTTADGVEVKMDGVVETGVADTGIDSGLILTEAKLDICDTGFSNGNVENTPPMI